jgi:NAD(P)-dependent dehydrogenase (short-subunit alcohol dehydrogenase family)
LPGTHCTGWRGKHGQAFCAAVRGPQGLIVGIANEHSIAYGCARALRELGAELAITYLNEKAKTRVEPLAQELGASIFLTLDVSKPGELEAVFDSRHVGTARRRHPFNRIRTEERSAMRSVEQFGGRVCASDGRLVIRSSVWRVSPRL